MGRRPHAPRRLTVKSAGPTGVTLTWKAPRGGTEPEAYLVFRDGRRIARTKRRAYTDRRATPGRHRYQVVAVDAKGRRGRPSAAVRARVPARAPEPFTPAAPAGPEPPPLPPPNVGSTLTAAMVDRLFWRAGFGATQAQHDAWAAGTSTSSTGCSTRLRRSPRRARRR